MFQNGKQMVQEGALTALASVADSSQVLWELIYSIDIYNYFSSLDYSFNTMVFLRSTSKNITML